MSGKGVLVYGEALVDIVPATEGRRAEAVLGGSGYNTALTLARCGAKVAYNASLSRDTMGKRFRVRMAEEGIDQRFVSDCDAQTPSATVESIDHDGAASYRFRLSGTAFDVAPPEPADLSDFAHLHVTSFGATLGVSGQAALALMRRAREVGLSVSYDLNIRLPVLPPPDQARSAIEERVPFCDLVKLSYDDAVAVDTGSGQDYERWFAGGLPLVLSTSGDHGADLYLASGGMISAFVPASEVVDTIGAGDSFMGAFLASLWQNGGLGPLLRDLPEEISASAMDFACRVAAETCGERGCKPPRLKPKPPYD
ncbi:PfkB family carbohydrate kinase [Bosea sp. (in: a-proteobacteria)]|uniref:PfkB family carbohydrate kinase n=1 Tax=Bosea sp. (in: a-proteobacteria) TaxID=1871050 RepID=UPI003F71C238